jgi:hypothetical protein
MQIWQDRVYPQYTRGQSGFDHVSQSSQRAVLWAVTHYNDVSGQLRCLEMTRWRHVKADIPDEKIWEAAQAHRTTAEAVKEVLWLCQTHRTNTTISRKEIRETTGLPAMPIMKAVSEILGFPYSLRGLTPNRAFEKEFGLRGKPTYRR